MNLICCRMITPLNIIDEQAFVTDLIARDYRTADVFKKYGIDFCCGAKWPLHTACELRGLDTQLVKQELQEAMRPLQTVALLSFAKWPLDFLTGYMVHVHHAYVRQALPSLKGFLELFVTEHSQKYTYLHELQQQFTRLHNNLPACMQHEEDVIFPYVKQVNRAFQGKASFAALLTRTLRKPVEKVMKQEHQLIVSVLKKMRELT